jgi:hypothetical protein
MIFKIKNPKKNNYEIKNALFYYHRPDIILSRM